MRTKFFDYDARRKGALPDLYCARCQKDLKPGQPHRWVHLIEGGHIVLHPEDEAEYVADAGDCGLHPVGMDCAKKIGLAWTWPETKVTKP